MSGGRIVRGVAFLAIAVIGIFCYTGLPDLREQRVSAVQVLSATQESVNCEAAIKKISQQLIPMIEGAVSKAIKEEKESFQESIKKVVEEEKASREAQAASSGNQASCPSEMDYDDDLEDNPFYHFFQKHKKGPVAHKYWQVHMGSSGFRGVFLRNGTVYVKLRPNFLWLLIMVLTMLA